MRNIIGFDVGTKYIAYCILSGETRFAAGIFNTREQLRNIINRCNVSHAYIEAPVYVNNRQVSMKLAMATGRLQEKLSAVGVRYDLIPIAKWKKLAIGKGNVNKEQVKEWAMTNTNLGIGYAQDCYDAAGVVLAGRKLELTKEEPAAS